MKWLDTMDREKVNKALDDAKAGDYRDVHELLYKCRFLIEEHVTKRGMSRLIEHEQLLSDCLAKRGMKGV